MILFDWTNIKKYPIFSATRANTVQVSGKAIFFFTKAPRLSYTVEYARNVFGRTAEARRVNAIACGVIDTIMNQQLSAEERKALEEEIPAGRYGTVEEIADMIWNVANAPAYMTGQVIGIDGGIL